ncbi:MULTISPECIES: ATP-binding protein [unclassified Nocardioides]|uniref:ATP-binding protein n=1 Tax=unclassified Nocardioides TaxID=2615069 RepID=UPI0000570FC5|nr:MULTISPECIES: ATP-binding protein [unclassified Nocardioides]ABL83787.1 ATP-binding region, ATPase domain protein [Nocardioides sp. JS614]
MPLNRPALSLGSGPRGVQDARRWVVGTCHDIGRSELEECAELGVSELVTNSLLHAQPPLSVRVRGTWEHPRVEVRDGSTDVPLMPSPDPQDDDDLLLTFGRGLSIVARCSTAWGVEVEEDGKVVWFVPSTHPGDLVEGVVTGVVAPAHPEPVPDELRIELRGVPLRTFVEFQRHYRELRREVRLLALAHEHEYPLAKDLSDLFGSLERDLREGIGADQIDRALESGDAATDLHVAMPRETAATIGRFIELLDLADAFCREERLLSLARTPEQQRFQRWFLTEFVRQAAGEPPLPCPQAMASDEASSGATAPTHRR